LRPEPYPNAKLPETATAIPAAKLLHYSAANRIFLQKFTFPRIFHPKYLHNSEKSSNFAPRFGADGEI